MRVGRAIKFPTRYRDDAGTHRQIAVFNGSLCDGTRCFRLHENLHELVAFFIHVLHANDQRSPNNVNANMNGAMKSSARAKTAPVWAPHNSALSFLLSTSRRYLYSRDNVRVGVRVRPVTEIRRLKTQPVTPAPLTNNTCVHNFAAFKDCKNPQAVRFRSKRCARNVCSTRDGDRLSAKLLLHRLSSRPFVVHVLRPFLTPVSGETRSHSPKRKRRPCGFCWSRTK